jgi:hypothetical protein
VVWGESALTIQLVKERKESGERCGDLLDRMLYGRDPVTGEGLSSQNIRYQLATFLVAGHEVGAHRIILWLELIITDDIRSPVLPIPLPPQDSSIGSSYPRRSR